MYCGFGEGLNTPSAASTFQIKKLPLVLGFLPGAGGNFFSYLIKSCLFALFAGKTG